MQKIEKKNNLKAKKMLTRKLEYKEQVMAVL